MAFSIVFDAGYVRGFAHKRILSSLIQLEPKSIDLGVFVQITELLASLKAQHANFNDVIAWIEAHYHYTPTSFDNGPVHNDAGQNAGSCKVFYAAKLLSLSAEDTLQLFAEHYRSVLNSPDATDHANIRAFMQHGWAGIQYHGVALTTR